MKNFISVSSILPGTSTIDRKQKMLSTSSSCCYSTIFFTSIPHDRASTIGIINFVRLHENRIEARLQHDELKFLREAKK
jgi:hypothetical protein